MRRPQQAIDVEQLDVDPHPLLAELRSMAPVCWVPELGGWIVTRWDLAVAVMRDPDTYTVDHPAFTTGQVLGSSMLSTDGELHRHHRDPFAETMRSSGRVDALAQYCDRAAASLVTELVPRGTAELRAELAAPLAVGAIRELLGLDNIDPAELLRTYREFASVVDALSVAAADVQLNRRHLNRLGEVVLAATDTSPVLRHVSQYQQPQELVANAAVMLFGGIETAEGMTATALWYLLTVPGLLARIVRDPGLISDLVEESLRLEPAAARVDRYATADVELADARILAGDLVIVSLTAANRDPGRFASPDTFRIDRPDRRRHLAFARGPHSCLGRSFAQAETVAAVSAVATGLPGVAIEPERMAGHRGLVFRKPEAVSVRW